VSVGRLVVGFWAGAIFFDFGIRDKFII